MCPRRKEAREQTPAPNAVVFRNGFEIALLFLDLGPDFHVNEFTAAGTIPTFNKPLADNEIYFVFAEKAPGKNGVFVQIAFHAQINHESESFAAVSEIPHHVLKELIKKILFEFFSPDSIIRVKGEENVSSSVGQSKGAGEKGS